MAQFTVATRSGEMPCADVVRRLWATALVARPKRVNRYRSESPTVSPIPIPRMISRSLPIEMSGSTSTPSIGSSLGTIDERSP